jgi:hypothetical protein
MSNPRRVRRARSVSAELLTKSREAALAAVQIFNSPLITFKSEIFIVLMHIAWTYMLQAHYRKQRVEYRYLKRAGPPRVFEKTKSGNYRHWDLTQCLQYAQCPVDAAAVNNLLFLAGIRHEIEHQLTSQLDASLSAKFQACCLNYNHYAKKLFGERFGIDKHLAFSLQFSSITRQQTAAIPADSALPSPIKAFVEGFEGKLSESEFNDQRYAYRVLFVAKTANRKGHADEVIEFVKSNSELAGQVNTAYALVRETERPKYLPTQIVKQMNDRGFPRFTMHHHTLLWKKENAKSPSMGFGVQVASTWYWYEQWLERVATHCDSNSRLYGAD